MASPILDEFRLLRYNRAGLGSPAELVGVTEAHAGAGAGLRQEVARGIRHDGDDGVSARDGTVGAEDDGMPVGRHLDGAGEHPLAREFGVRERRAPLPEIP